MSGKLAETFRDLGNDFCRRSVFATNAGYDGGNAEKSGQFGQTSDAGFQAIGWVSFAELEDSGLQISEEDDGILRVDS